MPAAPKPWRLAGPFLAFALALMLAALPTPAPAQQEPEFFDIPYAPGQWNYGRRLDESQLRYCVDRRDPDWEVAADIADALAGALLLEPRRYLVESEMVSEDITKVYGVMLEHCDVHMGFKLIPEGYDNWVTITRAYYETGYVFVASEPGIRALADLAATRPIGATIGTSAHLRLVSYLKGQAIEKRWRVFPYGSDDLALRSLLAGTVDLALVWAPSLWAAQRADPAYAGLRAVDSAPLPPTNLGVGAIVLSGQAFLRAAIDEAIAALAADGTIQSILDAHGFPASAIPP